MILMSSLDFDSRVKKEAKSLRGAGFDINILAVNSNPYDGFEIINVRHTYRRLFLPGISSLILYLKILVRGFTLLRTSKIIHCHDLNSLPIGAILKVLSLGKLKLIYDAHEFEINQIPNQIFLSIWFKKILEKFFIRFSDSVFTVSEGIANEYQMLYSINRPTIVLNCPNFTRFSIKNDLFREFFKIEKNKKIILYQGAFTKGRGIELLLDVFRKEDNYLDCVLVLMGDGPLLGVIQDSIKVSKSIYLHPPVLPDELMTYTNSADIGIVVADNVCKSYDLSLPNKLFEYIMADLPVIVSSLSEMKSFVEKHQIGVVVVSNDLDSLKKAISIILMSNKDQMSVKINRLKVEYCWERQAQLMINSYKSLFCN